MAAVMKNQMWLLPQPLKSLRIASSEVPVNGNNMQQPWCLTSDVNWCVLGPCGGRSWGGGGGGGAASQGPLRSTVVVDHTVTFSGQKFQFGRLPIFQAAWNHDNV